jgi:hypothetical protein
LLVTRNTWAKASHACATLGSTPFLHALDLTPTNMSLMRGPK